MFRSDDAPPRRRTSRARVGVLVLAVSAPAIALPTAQASHGCTYDAATRIVELSTHAGITTIARAGDAITADGQLCGPATVHNTDRIIVTGTPERDVVILRPGLAPGFSPEATGLSEIEVEADLGGGLDSVRTDGTPGNDHITIGTAGANVNGDDDADVIPSGIEGWSVVADHGNDHVSGQGGAGTAGPTGVPMSVVAGPGIDRLTGGSAGDELRGDIGNDHIDGESGIDTASYVVAPGAVTVDLAGTPAHGTASGADGLDNLLDIEQIRGSKFDDTLRGDDDPNAISGFLGEDTVLGRGGNDALGGGQGCDVLDGGDGADRVSFLDEPAAVHVDLRTQSALSPGCDRIEEFTSVEGANGSSHDDTLTGDDRANVLLGAAGTDAVIGLDGADVLLGAAGNDALVGGAGDDNVLPGPGDDVAHGGAGVDVLGHIDIAAGVIVDLSDRTTGGAAGHDSVAGFEDVQGSQFDDILRGDDSPNRLRGTGGDDDLFGRGEDDDLDGGPGVDSLDGGDGTDRCNAGAGNDPPPLNCEA